MPNRPKSPCSYPGCPVLLDKPGKCDKHAQTKRSGWSKDRAKQPVMTTTERGYGYAWRKIRDSVMLRDQGLCQVCLSNGRTRLAAEVDHITRKADGGTDDVENLQAICRECHRLKTAVEQLPDQQWTSFYPEWIPKPAIPVTVVAGPPGSGKSKYVEDRAKPGDLVLDVDVIAAEAYGLKLYEASYEQRTAAVRVRNKLLAGLNENTQYKRCWLIVTAPSEDKRHWWRDKLDAELVVLDVDKRICLDRIANDARRTPESKRRAREACLAWV